jgi:hypothetical protein
VGELALPPRVDEFEKALLAHADWIKRLDGLLCTMPLALCMAGSEIVWTKSGVITSVERSLKLEQDGVLYFTLTQPHSSQLRQVDSE